MKQQNQDEIKFIEDLMKALSVEINFDKLELFFIWPELLKFIETLPTTDQELFKYLYIDMMNLNEAAKYMNCKYQNLTMKEKKILNQITYHFNPSSKEKELDEKLKKLRKQKRDWRRKNLGIKPENRRIKD